MIQKILGFNWNVEEDRFVMKTVFIQADGMASVPLQELNGKSPLHVASTPNLDDLASQGEYGHLRLPVEANGSLSDIMHLALLGYDPNKYYSGPGPFEAASLEVVLRKARRRVSVSFSDPSFE